MCFDSRCPKFYELNYLVTHTKYLPLSWVSQLCWTLTILADENFHTMINFRIRNFIVLLAFYEGGILRAEHLDILWMRIFFFAMNCSRSLTRSLNETKAHTHTYLYVRHTFARYRHVNGTPYYFKSHIFENGVAIFFDFPCEIETQTILSVGQSFKASQRWGMSMETPCDFSHLISLMMDPNTDILFH